MRRRSSARTARSPTATCRSSPTAPATCSASSGVEMEDRVLMLCLDAPEFLGAFWGAIKIGAVPIPVNTLMRGQDYLYFLDDSRARVAVMSAPLLAEAGPVLGQAPFLQHVLVAGGAARSSLVGGPARPGLEPAGGGADLARRPGVLALLVGLDRAFPRARCICTTTWWSARRRTPSRCSASGRPTACSRRPSSSSPTGSATPATSPWAWAPRACSLRTGPRRRASSRS